MKRLKAALGYILITIFSFVLFSSIWVDRVDAESDSSSVITEITDFKASDYDKEKAYLFVQDGSEASVEVLNYLNTFSLGQSTHLDLNIVHLSKSGSSLEDYIKIFKEKCDLDTAYVPVMIINNVCTIGHDNIVTRIASIDSIGKDMEEVSTRFDENIKNLNEVIENRNSEVQSKTLFDKIKVIGIPVVIFIVILIVAVISIVLVKVFKDRIDSSKTKVIVTLQSFFMLASIGFLVYKVNDVNKSYAPMDSFAGCELVNGVVVGCPDFESRQDFIANNTSDEDGFTDKDRRKAEESLDRLEEDRKRNAQYLADMAAAKAYSDEMYVNMLRAAKEGKTKVTIGNTTYNFSSGALSLNNTTISVNDAITKAYEANGWKAPTIMMSYPEGGGETNLDTHSNLYAQGTFLDIYEKDEKGNIIYGKDGPTIKKSFIEAINAAKSTAYANLYEEVKDIKVCYCSSDKGQTLIDCGKKCESGIKVSGKILSISPEGVVKLQGIEEVDGKNLSFIFSNLLTVSFDNASGRAVLVPTGKTSVDPCEPESVGSNVYGSMLCNCGHYWTTAYKGASDLSCDIVCRAEDLVCDTCNPEPEEPPVIPPDVPGTPYCGDGILGNTSGEKCEKGDPTGVSCSWNVCDNKTCTCPTVTTPFCGDGIINVAGEQCEVGDPSGTSCKWETCNRTTCKCIKPGCGDGVLDAGEQCERDNPDGVTCKWDTCNQLKCECIEPGCGDGKLDTGEQCEKNNPTGASCLWEECDKSTCDCDVKVSEYCGDGKLQNGEQCELGNPSGTKCTWDKCSKATCMCPGQPYTPQTSIFDNSYMRNIVLGATMLLLGFLFYPTTKFIDSLYITIGQGVIKLGRYVTNNGEIRRKRKKKSIEDKFK